MNPTTPEFWSASAGAVVVLTGVTAWFRYVRPKWRRTRARAVAAWDSIVGREAVVDSITGKELAPALPGVGVRLDILTDAVAKIGDQHVRLEDHEAKIQELRDDVEGLKAASVERVVARAESAQAYRVIEAAIKATPDEDV